MKLTFWNLYFKVLIRPHYQGNDYQFTKYCQTPRNHRFQEVFCSWSSEREFEVLTIKFAPNPIVAQNMANLQNTVTGILFIVFYSCFGTYHVSNILESLQQNSYLTKLWLIRWLVWKILSHAWESSFSPSLMLLTITATHFSSYLEIVT